MRFAALMLLALPLAACDGPGVNISINASDDEGNAVVSSDSNGQMAIKVPGFEGSMKLPKLKIDAEDFDVNGLKLYPGSTIRDLNIDARERLGERDKGTVTVSFESPTALATVQDWFRDNLARRGFKVEPKGNGFAGTTDEGDPFSLTLEADGDQKTKGRIDVGN